MKITIDKINNKKLFIDECYGILSIYKKLLRNPNSKIKLRSKKIVDNLIFILMYFIVMLILSIIEKASIYYLCLGISITSLLIFIVKLTNYSKYIKNYEQSETCSILIIDDVNITLENKVSNIKYLVEWRNIKSILFSKNCIVFMTNFDKTKLNNIIMLSREYEKELLEILDKYKKTDLIKYN